jgi:hypothetical protein
MNVEELSSLSYRDLQKLAKTKGVKARQPREALIKAILESGNVENIEKAEKGLDETFDASIVSSIMTDDAKSEIETEPETDEEEKVPEDDSKSGKRQLSERSPPAKGSKSGKRKVSERSPPLKRNTKRRRFAEFYSAPRSSSPISSERRPSIDEVVIVTPPTKVLNKTITLDSPAVIVEAETLNTTITVDKISPADKTQTLETKIEDEREEEILSSGKVATPVRSSGRKKASLNTTITVEPEIVKAKVEKKVETQGKVIDRNPRKSSIAGGNRKSILPESVSALAMKRKSLLGIPLRKSLVGSPGSIRKARPSVSMSSQKLAFAAKKMVQLTPSKTDPRKSLAAGSVKKTVESSKPGNNL